MKKRAEYATPLPPARFTVRQLLELERRLAEAAERRARAKPETIAQRKARFYKKRPAIVGRSFYRCSSCGQRRDVNLGTWCRLCKKNTFRTVKLPPAPKVKPKPPKLPPGTPKACRRSHWYGRVGYRTPACQRCGFDPATGVFTAFRGEP